MEEESKVGTEDISNESYNLFVLSAIQGEMLRTLFNNRAGFSGAIK